MPKISVPKAVYRCQKQAVSTPNQTSETAKRGFLHDMVKT